jgi:hypothetical protein
MIRALIGLGALAGRPQEQKRRTSALLIICSGHRVHGPILGSKWVAMDTSVYLRRAARLGRRSPVCLDTRGPFASGCWISPKPQVEDDLYFSISTFLTNFTSNPYFLFLVYFSMFTHVYLSLTS